MSTVKLGSIRKATFGYGGYQDAMIGLALEFGGEGWGSATFEGTWAMPPSSNAECTVADQDAHYAKAVRLLNNTLEKAKKRHCAELVGVPVELTFDRPFGKLESWRVLTEVIA